MDINLQMNNLKSVAWMWHLESMENYWGIFLKKENMGDFSQERKHGYCYKVLFGHFVQNIFFILGLSNFL